MPARGAPAQPAKPPGWSLRLAEVVLWALVVLPPLWFRLTAHDAFRLPKLLLGEWLALASLVPLAWRLRDAGQLAPRRLAALPVVRAVVPLLAVATLTLATSEHRLHVGEGLIDLWIGVVCLVAWSQALPAGRLRRLLDGLLLPAAFLSVLGAVQFHDLWDPVGFVGGEEARRLGVTSLAGNPGDLGAFLVLPALLAQQALGARRRRPWLWGLALALTLYGLAVSQSLTALAALAAGSSVLWWGRLTRRRALALLAAGAALAAALAIGVAPLRERLVSSTRALAEGRVNDLLTGRLDGWSAAVWMLGEHPLAGVGHGAYRAEFARAKLALSERGVEFYRGQQQPGFANAHSEYLEVGAEWGVPGLLALAWGMWVLWRQTARGPSGATAAGEQGLARAGLVSMAVLAVAFFPWRIGLVAFPGLLLLAWVFAAAAREEAA